MPLVGWQVVEALRDVADIHLVTQVRNREAILRQGWHEGVDFTSIDSEAVAAGLYRLAEAVRGGANKGWTTLMAVTAPSHYYFEHLAWRRFKDRLKRGAFDIVHRVTPLSPTIPSPIAHKCKRIGVPFVIGPLNGGVPWPKGYDDRRHAEREWLSHVRAIYKLLPYARQTRANAAAIIAASRWTWEEMPRAVQGRCFYVPENGIDPRKFRWRRAHTAQRPLKLVFVGRLVPFKAADIVIDAAAPMLARGDATLEIIGDGPERAHLETLVRAHHVEGAVTMAGWLEHKLVPERIAQADVLAFPSLREFGGGVVLEAMAAGVVPVVVKYGGPGELVTPDTGIAIPIAPRDQLVTRFRAELEGLVRDPRRVDTLSAQCVAAVERSFTWARKAEQIATVYDWVLGRGPRPNLPLPSH